MPPIKHILVPIDWSEQSNRIFELAASLAEERNAQLVILGVVPSPTVIYGPPPENYLNHLFEELCQIKPSNVKTRVEYLLMQGNPATAILKAARESRCDLIVMGTHGRKGLRRVLMGSVAEEVVRKAPCPVLTVMAGVPMNLISYKKALKGIEESTK